MVSKVVTLARHPCGAGVLEVAYSLANSVQRSALVAEFYGPEFALKAHGAIVKGGAGLTLKDALADPQVTFPTRSLPMALQMCNAE